MVRDVWCPGPQNDVSIWGDLIILSVDTVLTDSGCSGARASRRRSRRAGRDCASSGSATYSGQIQTQTVSPGSSRRGTFTPTAAHTRIPVSRMGTG